MHFKNSSFWKLILTGFCTLLSLSGALIYFSLAVPLQKSVIAQGSTAVSGNLKVVKHISGGLVKHIHIVDNQRVKKGQLLIKLDDTQIKSSLKIHEDQLVFKEIKLARLIAEQNNKFDFDKLNHFKNNPIYVTLIEDQQEIFKTQQKNKQLQLKMIQEKQAQFKEVVDGLKKKIMHHNKQQDVSRKELKEKQTFIDKNLSPESSLYAVKRNDLELDSKKAELSDRVLSIQNKIAEINLKTEEIINSYDLRVIEELSTTREKILNLTEKIKPLRYTLEHTEIKAPVDGVIVGLKIFNNQGVISPGENILTIVPSNDTLIINALVKLNDIDSVKVGMQSQVRFMAMNQRQKLPAKGIIRAISADKVFDPESSGFYYKTIIEVTENLEDQIDSTSLVPGMKADVIINSGDTTLIAYLLEPLMQSLRRAITN